jgi:hypothetical protein
MFLELEKNRDGKMCENVAAARINENRVNTALAYFQLR